VWTTSSCWGRRICVGSCESMLAITILRERTGHWTRMLRSLARFSRSDASCRTPWLAGCITNMSGFRFSARTGRDLERGRRGYRATALHLCRPRRPDWRRERIVGRALPRAACETLIQFSKGPCPSMKSLRWPFSSSPIGVSRESSSLAILITLRAFTPCRASGRARGRSR